MFTRSAAAVLLLIGLVGCQKGPPEIASLTGKVTLDGKPLSVGIVSVVSGDDVTRGSARIAADGTYSIVGAPVGPVKLSVSTEDDKIIYPEPGSGSTKERPNPKYVAIPKKYEKFETSGLETTIPKGKGTYDVVLTSK